MKKAFFQLHLSIILAGFTGILGKLITVNEGLLVWYRLLFSSVLLLLWLLYSRNLRRFTLRSAGSIAGTGLLLALHWVFFYGSIKYANVSIGVVCFAMSSFFTACFEPLINRQKFSLIDLLLSALTLTGIALIFHFDVKYRTGIILGVISSILVALYTIYNKKLVQRYDGANIMFYQLLGGLIGLTLLSPLYLRLIPVSSFMPSLQDVFYLLLLSAFCTICLYLLLIKSLTKISAFTVNLSFNLEPVYSIILAIIIFNENKELTLVFYIGLALIILSVVLQMLRVMASTRKA